MNERALWWAGALSAILGFATMLVYDIRVPDDQRAAWTSEMVANLVAAMFALATAGVVLAVSEMAQRRRLTRALLADIDQTLKQLDATMESEDSGLTVVLEDETRIRIRANAPFPVGILEAAKSDAFGSDLHHKLLYAVGKMEALRTRVNLLLQVLATKGEGIQNPSAFALNLRTFFLEPIETQMDGLRKLLREIRASAA